MGIDEDFAAARHLAGQAHEVGYASGREPWREVVQWLTRGRYGRRRGWPVVPQLATPWQDTISAQRIGWRQRAANLDGEFAFAVDYQLCRRLEQVGRAEPAFLGPVPNPVDVVVEPLPRGELLRPAGRGQLGERAQVVLMEVVEQLDRGELVAWAVVGFGLRRITAAAEQGHLQLLVVTVVLGQAGAGQECAHQLGIRGYGIAQDQCRAYRLGAHTRTTSAAAFRAGDGTARIVVTVPGVEDLWTIVDLLYRASNPPMSGARSPSPAS